MIIKIKNWVAGNGLLLLGLLALYGVILGPLLSGKIYAEFDLREQVIPWRMYYKLSLARGEPGLWNPFFSRGYDHLGEGQSGILHPGHFLLYYFLPVTVAICLEMVLVFPFAFVGMSCLLVKSAGIKNPTAVLLGAGLFAFNTFFFAHLPHLNMIWVYAHLPWLMLFLERVFNDQAKGRHAGLLALTIASMLLLGHPQMVWINGLAALMVLVFLSLIDRLKWSRESLIALSLGVIAGLLVGMLQLLPTFDFFTQSARNQLTAIERENFSLHPYNLLINLSSYFFIDKSVGDWFYKPDGSHEFFNSHQEYPGYVGIASLTIIMAGLVVLRRPGEGQRWRRMMVLGGLWFIFFLLLAMGKYGWLNGCLRFVPYLSQFRCPVRYLAVVMFGVAFVCAWFADRMSRQHLGEKRSGKFILIALPLVGSLLLLIYGGQHRYIPFLDTRLYLGSLSELVIGPIVALASLLLVKMGISGRRWAWQLLGLICWLDVVSYAAPIIYRMEWRSLADISSAYIKMQTAEHTYRHVSALNQPIWEGAYLANGYLGIAPQDNWELLTNKKHLQLTSVRYAHGTTRVFTVADALPRARLVRELKHSINPLSDLTAIDIEQTALCYPDVAPEFSGPVLNADETVKLSYDGGDRIVIQLHVNQPRLLVLSDRWSRWWHATIDGRHVPVLALFDRSMRGLMASPGDREIVMTYRPKTLYWGILSAVLGAIILIYLLRADKLNRR